MPATRAPRINQVNDATQPPLVEGAFNLKSKTMVFYATFPNKSTHKEYFVEIHAESREEAKKLLESEYTDYFEIQSEADFDPSWYAKGRLDILHARESTHDEELRESNNLTGLPHDMPEDC